VSQKKDPLIFKHVITKEQKGISNAGGFY